ncbi:major facilitator superfamily MFS_1 [Actinobacteria bacterium OK074]|nr:major facilitator superfamily MFS_1 [Actinobacteria bacterium OK074]
MTETLIPAAPATTDRPAHRDPNVLRWLGAYAASTAGDNIYYVALSWAAVQAGTPAQAGLVMSVSALPRALLMLGGGVIADRFGPRRVVIGSDAVRCAAVLGVAAALVLGSPGLWLLAVLAVVFGAVDAVFTPAVGALPARITHRGQLARVQGMRGLVNRLANVVGAPLGGLCVALGGATAAFGLTGMLIAVSVPLLVSVRMSGLPVDGDTRAYDDGGDPRVSDKGAGGRDANDRGAGNQGASDAAEPVAVRKPPSGSTGRRDLREGLAYIRHHRVLAPLIVAVALGDLGFVGPLNAGLTLLADQRGWGASGMGLVIAGFGTGAGATSLLLTVRGRLPHAGRLLAVSILPGAVAIGALAWVPGVAAAVGLAVLIGLFAGLSGTLCGALVQTQSDPAYLGRVSSVSGIVSLGIAPLTMPVTAAAIGWWGTGPVFLASAAVCGLSGVVALCSGPLRRAELPG